MTWAGATWKHGIVIDGVRIQRGIPWMGEDDLIALLEDICPDGWITS